MDVKSAEQGDTKGGPNLAELVVVYPPHSYSPVQFSAPYSHVPTRIWVDDLGDTTSIPDTMRVLLLFEPNAINKVAKDVCASPDRWDYILTHNRRVLLRCHNAIRFLHGTTWIHDYHFPTKEFAVSHLVSKVRVTNGHYLRRTLWERRNEITVPRKFYLAGGVTDYDSEGYILGDSKAPLFDTQFHLTIENCRTRYYFTEKLIDCFQTKTVPIYYGAKRISRWFNTKGMFNVCDADEAIRACESLNPDTYDRMRDAVEDNYQRSFRWLDVNVRLQAVITELSSLWPRRRRFGYVARRVRDLA